ncbi:MAG: hypothetical protein KDI36_05220 [Pseudomonadales bacterium]|nr:hypothetical protein [Pseudomonadales bacterium]
MTDYGLLSLLPPVVTVILAVITRSILFSLATGVFLGSMILSDYNPFLALLDMIEKRIFVEIAVGSNIQIIFTMMAIGGFIHLLETSGGARSFARKMAELVTSPRRAQLATWTSGLSIFFTDAGNALIIGPLFRPVFRELRICREKLAWILDSTASPTCILVPFIGWGAYIMSLIDKAYTNSGLTAEPLSVLLNVMPFQFYAILALLSVPLVIVAGRDFGPMARAQARFSDKGSETALEAEPAPPVSPAGDTGMDLFLVPILTLLGLIAGLLIWYAWHDDLTSVHVRSTMTIAYVAASIACGSLMYKYFGTGMEESLNLFIRGAEKMVLVVVILILAWSLSSVIKDLGTAATLSSLIGSTINPGVLPAIVFVLGALISLATGSSWGTFAILMGLAVPVAVTVGAPLYLTIGAVLSGGLFGDHTSPISDTTVLSSIGADCPHIDHVNTQFHYALTTGVAAFFTFLAGGFITSPLVLILGIVLLISLFTLRFRFSEQVIKTN